MRRPPFFIIILITLLVSCKNNGKEQKEEIEFTGRENEHFFRVTIRAMVPEDDVFEVYYYEMDQEGFLPNQFVPAKVKGSPNSQEINFELPDDVYPARLRLDLGKYRQQQKMRLDGVTLSFRQHNYEFSEAQLDKDLKPSRFLKYDTTDNTIETMVIDNRYDPYFYTMRVTGIVDYLLEQ